MRVISDMLGLDDCGKIDTFNNYLNLLDVAAHSHSDDRNNIFVISINIASAMLILGIDQKTIDTYKSWGFAPIMFYCTANGTTDCNKFDSNDFLQKIVALRKISNPVYQSLRKSVGLIDVYRKSGILTYNDICPERARPLSDEFNALSSLYTSKINDYYSLAETSLPTRLSDIRAFLFCLEQHKIVNANDFTMKDISECITKLSVNYDGGLRSVIGNIKKFLGFLYESGVTAIDYRSAIPTRTPKRRKIQPAFSEDEIADILDSVDRTTAKGKRDYPIMLIAAKTGLRTIDIVNLKLSDIDWRTHEIKVVQQKTGVPLCLPLTAEVGNAIAEYILEARPKNESNRIFFNYYKFDKPLTTKSVIAMVRKYVEKARVNTADSGHYGVHCFRRAFGKRMLESSIPADMLSELLGQVHPDSVKPYISIDEEGLKHCAIGLIPLKAEVFSDAI